MSATGPSEETPERGEESFEGCGQRCGSRGRKGYADFGTVASERRSLNLSHANLTRAIWMRRTMERALAGRQYKVDVGQSGAGKGRLRLMLLGEPIPSDLIPYAQSVGDGFWQFPFFGESGKMGCPTLDLPSGAPAVGGSCPASASGQTIVEPEERTQLLERDSKGHYYLKERSPQLNLRAPLPNEGRVRWWEGDEPDAKWQGPICQECYAGGGNYKELTAALGNIIRYRWIESLINSGRSDELVETLVEGLLLEQYPVEYGLKPVRVHSSGDFYDPRYMAVWIEVANRIAKIDSSIAMWAPTRSWASPKIAPYWRNALDQLEQPNLIVRCSAYHTGDYAPGALHPNNAVGTTAVYRDDNKGNGVDPRFDWTCPVYNVWDDGHTCQTAHDPVTKKLGCRMCWTHPELRVNFTVHV